MRASVGRLGARLGLDRWRALPITRRRQILTPTLLGVGVLFPFLSGNAGNVAAFTDTDIFDGLVTVSMNGGTSVPASVGLWRTLSFMKTASSGSVAPSS